MPDRRYVLAGLVLFLLAASYPAWRAAALGTVPAAPRLAKARRQPCVLPPALMRASHMNVLAEWRDLAVRRGVRRITAPDGRLWTVSLTATCLDCHEKAKFCDRCHEYAGVQPECWTCHVVPVSGGPEGPPCIWGRVVSATRRLFLQVAGASALAAAAGCATDPGRRRLAMVIDTAKCLQKDGCRACVDACHRVHNVPSIPERQHEVKWIWKERFEKAFGHDEQQALPVALRGRDALVFCNHCDNPPCVRVCPTRATWKRDDGIVAIDEHRCIGCRYCAAACPYGSRSFNWSDPRPHLARIDPGYPTRAAGVVEKCTFCEERLAVGRPPACVEACPEHALVFGNLRDPAGEARRLLDARFAIRRKPELGTRPSVYYLV